MHALPRRTYSTPAPRSRGGGGYRLPAPKFTPGKLIENPFYVESPLIITKSVSFRGEHIDNLLIAYAKTLCDQLDKATPGLCKVEIKTEKGALKTATVFLPVPEDLGGAVVTAVSFDAIEIKNILISEATSHVPANFREVDKVGFDFELDTANLIKMATVYFSKIHEFNIRQP
jgi:hypothetical protein